MRLSSRLLVSHTVLAGVLLAALGVAVASLVRMTALISEVRDEELGSIADEQEVHGAAWGVEVAVRQAIVACEQRSDHAAADARLRAGLARLDAVLARRRGPIPVHLARPVRGYRAFVVRHLGADACDRVRAPDSREARLALDEDLTNAWIARTYELNRAVQRKEEQARALGTRASAVGLGLGLCAAVAGVFAARRMARGVAAPLAELARAARRVGGGDFSPIALARGPTEVVALSQDLERMRAQLAELDKLKQGFVASVSHELRTPLARLREALGLLEDGTAGPLTDRQRRVVQLARRACEREIRTVNALLDLSRIRSGRAALVESGCAIDRVLREALDEERAAADARGVALALDAPGEGPTLRIDGPLVERAVANVVRNAVSVTAPGGAVHVARALAPGGPGGRPGTWVRVAVRDHGPGVAPEARDRLFEAFATHAVASEPGRVGVGLGLALAREAFRAHGGEVELAETEGPGATFVMWLPLEPRREGAGTDGAP